MTILAPIQQHVEALANHPGYPSAAVDACVALPEQSAPLLRAILQRAARGTALSDAEADQMFVGLHILAKLRDSQSFPPLMRLLRRPFADVDALLGDVVTATLPQIIASVFDGDDEALFEMIADASFDAYLRDAVWRAVTWLTFEGRIDRDRTRASILRFDAERMAPKGDMAWVGWLGSISHLGSTTSRPPSARSGSINGCPPTSSLAGISTPTSRRHWGRPTTPSDSSATAWV